MAMAKSSKTACFPSEKVVRSFKCLSCNHSADDLEQLTSREEAITCHKCGSDTITMVSTATGSVLREEEK